MRQYFADEKLYESFDKVKWVYDSAERKSAYASFSPGQPQRSARISIKNANCVLNTQDVSDDFSVTFGESSPNPFKTKSVFGRSAMSDGAISPEGTRAFTKGVYLGSFPINTGEGSLTSNFFYTHKYTRECKFFEIHEGTIFAKMTEIKIAQGAKQTGGKLLGSKVSEAIAYYRGVEAQKALQNVGVRDKVKLIASEKVLTPDDAIVLFGIGADFVAIARAFMMSAGCIRARECSGAHGRACPVYAIYLL